MKTKKLRDGTEVQYYDFSYSFAISNIPLPPKEPPKPYQPGYRVENPTSCVGAIEQRGMGRHGCECSYCGPRKGHIGYSGSL